MNENSPNYKITFSKANNEWINKMYKTSFHLDIKSDCTLEII
jgi:hypothetical protein